MILSKGCVIKVRNPRSCLRQANPSIIPELMRFETLRLSAEHKTSSVLCIRVQSPSSTFVSPRAHLLLNCKHLLRRTRQPKRFSNLLFGCSTVFSMTGISKSSALLICCMHMHVNGAIRQRYLDHSRPFLKLQESKMALLMRCSGLCRCPSY